MKWLAYVVLAFAIFQIEARSAYHASLESEYECLRELNLEMKDVLPYVHVVTSPDDPERISEFLACVWDKRKIIDKDGNVDVDSIVKYFLDIYHKIDLTEEIKEEIRTAVTPCGKIQDDQRNRRAILAKNCMITASGTLSFLPKPNPKN